MKKSMSREHADLLKRCYMSMGLDHDVVEGLQSRKAEAYHLLADIHEQVNTPRSFPENKEQPGSCRHTSS